MLGLGRALGETIAVAMVCGVALGQIPTNIYGEMTTIAANIVQNLDTAITGPLSVKTYAELALVLMVITLERERGRAAAGPPGIGYRAAGRPGAVAMSRLGEHVSPPRPVRPPRQARGGDWPAIPVRRKISQLRVLGWPASPAWP